MLWSRVPASSERDAALSLISSDDCLICLVSVRLNGLLPLLSDVHLAVGSAALSALAQAGGIFARELGARMGMDVPTINVQHQYMVRSESLLLSVLLVLLNCVCLAWSGFPARLRLARLLALLAAPPRAAFCVDVLVSIIMFRSPGRFRTCQRTCRRCATRIAWSAPVCPLVCVVVALRVDAAAPPSPSACFFRPPCLSAAVFASRRILRSHARSCW